MRIAESRIRVNCGNWRTLVPALAAFLLIAVGPVGAGEPLKAVLLVIDVQKGFLPYMSEEDAQRAPDWINGAISLFRQRDLPVIRVYHTDAKWGPPEDSDEFQFIESINVQESDPRIVKHYPNAFRETKLADLLEKLDANTLFLCGLSGTGCVLATYYGAYDRDYRVYMIENALISPETEHTRAVEGFCSSINLEALKLLLQSTAP